MHLDISKEFEKKLQIAKGLPIPVCLMMMPAGKYISHTIMAKNQYYGNLIRVDYGEPFHEP